MSLLDKDWTKRMKEDKALKHKSLDEILKKMKIILLDRFPLPGRRIDHERIRKSNNELPSAFMERLFSSMYSSQMDTAPPVAKAVVRIIHLLGPDGLSKSVKDHLIKVMRENPNLDKKEEVMTYVYAMKSDEVAKATTEKKDKINAVVQTIDCKVCLKKT